MKCENCLELQKLLVLEEEVEQLKAENEKLKKYKKYYEAVMKEGINPDFDYPCKDCDGPVAQGRQCGWCGNEGPEPADRWWNWRKKGGE